MILTTCAACAAPPAHNAPRCVRCGELKRFEEAKTVLREAMLVARRVLGEEHRLVLKMGYHYAQTLYEDSAASLDDLREAVTTLEEIQGTARRVLGGAHPLTVDIERELRHARAVLRARETPPAGDK